MTSTLSAGPAPSRPRPRRRNRRGWIIGGVGVLLDPIEALRRE